MKDWSKKNCYWCKNSKFIPGYPGDRECPPDEDEIICLIAEGKEASDQFTILGDQHEWNPDIMPDVCGCYEDRMIDNCDHCGEPIKQPERGWPHAGSAYGKAFFCSGACKRKQYNAEYEQERKDYEAFQQYKEELEFYV